MNIHPVILSGGGATRLWPLSRESFPKQLHALLGEFSLLQETARRVAGFGAPIVVCNDEHRFIIAEQLRSVGVPPATIILEPVGRNTAPAAAVAALMLADRDAQARMLVLPPDHHIRDSDAFVGAVERATGIAGSPLLCFGVRPDHPHTGYGYIRQGEELGDGAARIERFVEKPDTDTAKSCLEDGGYLWNAGIFLFPVGRYLQELGRARPEMLEQCRAALEAAGKDLDFTRLGEREFAAIEGESIDYAVMENAADAAVVPLDAGWSDIGSWSSLHAESEHDSAGNAISGDVTVIDCRNNYLRSEKGIIAAIGVENLAVIVAQDAVLVVNRDHDQRVGELVAALKSAGRREATQTARGWRPWGWFETIEEGPRFHVKQLMVDPGQSLSLQMHRHRSEHWVVVEGTAEVTLGEKTFPLQENESTFIPAGTRHRLANKGQSPLRIVEIQVGAYFGEDDIIRFSDIYGRIAADGDKSDV